MNARFVNAPRRGGTLGLRRISKSFDRLLVCLLFIAPAAGLRAQSSPAYGLFLGQELVQVGLLTQTNTSRAAYWECWARGFASNQLTSAQALTPGSQTYGLRLDSEGAYVTEDYPLASARDADFPPGTYSLSVTGASAFSATVSLTESAAAYPAPPSFPISLILEGIPAFQDEPISWNPGTDTMANDVFMVALVDGNGNFVFNTPWPGQANALSGLATNATIPGSVLTPGSFLELKLILFRIGSQQNLPNGAGVASAGSATVVMEFVAVSSLPPGNDVALYQLLEGRGFTQQGEGAPVGDTNNAFAFEASAWGADLNRLTNATIVAPGLKTLSLQPVGSNLEWKTNVAFGLQADLDSAFPAGAYRWGFDGLANGHQAATNTLTAGAWPAPMEVTNWTACQTNSFTNSVIVTWMPPADASANDNVEFVVIDAGQNEVFHAPNYGAGDSPLPGTTTQVSIPANTLFDGLAYQARLRYLRVVNVDTQSLAGATGLVGRYAETRFPIGSRVALPLEIVTTNLPDAAAGQAYHVQLTAEGGRQPWTWSLVTGALPAGLSSESSGAIRGTPSQAGVFPLTVQLTDSLGNSAQQPLSLSVTGTLPALAFATTNLPAVQDGLYYLQQLAGQGGVPPVSWSIALGQLPPGLVLDSNTGIISGLAQQAGSFPIQLQLRDAAGRTQYQTLTVTVPSVTNNPILRISQFSLLPGQQGHAQLNTRTGEVCTVEVSTNLAQWQTLFTTNMGDSGVLDWASPFAPAAFYRAFRGRPRPVPDPFNVSIVLDTNASVGGILTSAGLTLSLTNASGQVWRLEVPTNAVGSDTSIRMTALQGVNNLPFQGGLIGGVSFGPERLMLLNPATLTVSFPGGVPADALAFAFEGPGFNLHLYPAQVTSSAVIYPIMHFSGVGLGHGTPNDANNPALQHVCDEVSNLEFAIAYLTQWGTYDPTRAEWALFLKQWFWDHIYADLKAAAADDSILSEAVQEVLQWDSDWLEHLPYDAGDEYHQDLVLLGGIAESLEADAFVNGVNAPAARCVNQHRPWQAYRMVEVADLARLLGLGKYYPNFFDSSTMTTRFEALFRFDLSLDQSRVEYFASKGGYSEGSVDEGLTTFVPQGLPYGSGSPVPQPPLVGNSGELSYVDWRLATRPVEPKAIPSAGQINGIYLFLNPNYDVGAYHPCGPDLNWNDPPSADIDCSFDAVDPVQNMLAWSPTKKTWVEISALVNWWDLFELKHGAEGELFQGTDASGTPRLGVHFVTDKWEYFGAGDPFARAELSKTFSGSDGTATEYTILELHHHPSTGN